MANRLILLDRKLSLAEALLARWNSEGLALDFTDMSAVVRGGSAPFRGNANNLLSITTDPKWILSSSGVYVQTSANTLATEYDSSGNALGVRIEEARTNSIRNSTMVGASAPSTLPSIWSIVGTDGLTTEVVGVGTQNGINYIDLRLSGTSAGSGDYRIQFDSVAAVTGQTWTLSLFAAHVGGTTTNISGFQLRHTERNGGALVTSQTGPTTPFSTELTRSVYTATLSGGATVTANCPEINVITNNSSAIDITLRIGWPQLELGAFATSPIPTTTAAVARAIDNVSLATSLFPAGSAYTLYFEGAESSFAASAASYALSLGDGTANNFLAIARNTGSTNITSFAFNGGASQAAVASSNTASAGVLYKAAARYAANSFNLALNGTIATLDSAGTMPTVNTLRLGNRGDGLRPFNGHQKRIMVLPVGRVDADLQALTT